MPVIDRSPQGVESRLAGGMGWVGNHEQVWVEKHLLRLALRYAVPVVLSGVAWIPIEADNALKVDHRMYITIIYNIFNPTQI